MTVSVDAHLEGNPEQVHGCGWWLRETWAAGVAEGGSATMLARAITVGRWEGRSSEAFGRVAVETDAAAREHAAVIEHVADVVTAYAERLGMDQRLMEHYLEQAHRARLPTSGTLVLYPLDAPRVLAAAAAGGVEPHEEAAVEAAVLQLVAWRYLSVMVPQLHEDHRAWIDENVAPMADALAGPNRLEKLAKFSEEVVIGAASNVKGKIGAGVEAIDQLKELVPAGWESIRTGDAAPFVEVVLSEDLKTALGELVKEGVRSTPWQVLLEAGLVTAVDGAVEPEEPTPDWYREPAVAPVEPDTPTYDPRPPFLPRRP